MKLHSKNTLSRVLSLIGYELRPYHLCPERLGYLRSITARFTEQIVQFLFHRLGYHVSRTTWSKEAIDATEDIDSVAAMAIDDAQNYVQWTTPGPIFAPWLADSDFEAQYQNVSDLTLVSRERCYTLAMFARHAMHLHGAFAECGVFRGGTALLLSSVVKGTERPFYLFDSFEGLPKPHPEYDRFFYEGQFSFQSIESLRQKLRRSGVTPDIRKGWIPATFSDLENESYAFVHIDVDLYQSVWDCCEYFYSRLVPGGIMIFDEYGFPGARGERKAVDEFFSDRPEGPIALPTGQAIVLKSPADYSRACDAPGRPAEPVIDCQSLVGLPPRGLGSDGHDQ